MIQYIFDKSTKLTIIRFDRVVARKYNHGHIRIIIFYKSTFDTLKIQQVLLSTNQINIFHPTTFNESYILFIKVIYSIYFINNHDC